MSEYAHDSVIQQNHSDKTFLLIFSPKFCTVHITKQHMKMCIALFENIVLYHNLKKNFQKLNFYFLKYFENNFYMVTRELPMEKYTIFYLYTT